MGLYDKHILPKVVDWACRQKPTRKQREKIIPLAHGNVLEIGIGSGLNLPFYDKTNVKHLTAIDPSIEIWNQNKFDVKSLPFEFNFIKAIAENIPVDNNSFDYVVITYTLCSIPDVSKAFNEIRRVIKPNGKLLFCEHGKAPDKSVQKWQNYINPIWKKLGGGCTLNKDIPSIIKNNGFKIINMETMYIPGWKPASFNFWGSSEIK
ncbi:class I SAM-dependent methyltransferase [Aestuariivivens marinum]|uniref:class I SAM-dependent methyltransferase n=1 Tax=Aestuariivivens marinum TaxID=2913555 RepID=UPI001F55BE82|nr:class I SAM-dependent methyltransferase [Aestuariivivens marinum]